MANSEDGALAERLFSERLRWVKRYNNYDPAKPYIISEEAAELFWEGVKYWWELEDEAKDVFNKKYPPIVIEELGNVHTVTAWAVYGNIEYAERADYVDAYIKKIDYVLIQVGDEPEPVRAFQRYMERDLEQKLRKIDALIDIKHPMGDK